jgi:hypothetical protein
LHLRDLEMKELKLVKGPHVLFRGSNGVKTPGITVESLGPKEKIEDRGRARRFDINLYTLQAHPERYAEALGQPIEKMITDLEKLARPNTARGVLARYRIDEVSPEHLCEIAKKVLWYGPARGHNEVELSHLAPELAAKILIHFGLGDKELELEE